MKRREFLVGLGAAAAVASASQVMAQSAPASGMERVHEPKYEALEESTAHCVGTGDDCMRHCFGLLSMGDATMAGCTKAVYDLVAGCDALHTLAAVNSPHTPRSPRRWPTCVRAAGKSAKNTLTSSNAKLAESPAIVAQARVRVAA